MATGSSAGSAGSVMVKRAPPAGDAPGDDLPAVLQDDLLDDG